MSPEDYVKRLIEISEKKHKLLQDLFVLTGEQAKNITEDGLEQLDKVIAAKQSIMGDIDKLDEEFNVYFLRLKQGLGIKSLSDLRVSAVNGMKELQDSVKNVMELIKQISELDAKNNEDAKKLLQHLGDEIKKINQGKKVNVAYKATPVIQPTSYFIDKKK